MNVKSGRGKSKLDINWVVLSCIKLITLWASSHKFLFFYSMCRLILITLSQLENFGNSSNDQKNHTMCSRCLSLLPIYFTYIDRLTFIPPDPWAASKPQEFWIKYPKNECFLAERNENVSFTSLSIYFVAISSSICR